MDKAFVGWLLTLGVGFPLMVELIVIPAAEIVRLIQTNPDFASEIIRFIEKRKQTIVLT